MNHLRIAGRVQDVLATLEDDEVVTVLPRITHHTTQTDDVTWETSQRLKARRTTRERRTERANDRVV